MKIIIIFLTLVVILSSFVSADPTSSYSNHHPQFTIEHSGKQTFQTTISNNNKVYDIICTYTLKKDNQNVEAGSYTISNTNQIPYSYTFTVNDYTLEQHIYTLNFICYDSLSCIFSCKTITQPYPTIDYDITIKSDLNVAERSAKLYIETNLKNNEATLADISTSLQKLDYKINSLKPNVKIGNIKNDFNTYNTKFILVNSNVQQVDNLYGTAHYIEAKNTFDMDQFNLILGIKTNVDSLSNQIDEIEKRHNQDTEKIEGLNGLLNTNQKLAIAVDKQQEYNDLQTKISFLANNFDTGNFNTYDEIESSITSFINQINDLKSQWTQLLISILTKGNSLLADESKSFCQNKGICGFNKVSLANDIKDLDSICNVINLINQKIENIFKEETLKYENYIKNITEINEKIQQENQIILSQNKETEKENDIIKNINNNLKILNDLTQEVNELIKKNHIEIDTNQCATSVSKVQSNKTIDNINLAISECTKLKADIIDIRIEKEKNFLFKIKRLFFFLTSFNFDRIPQTEEIKLKEQLLLKDELKVTLKAPEKFKIKDDTLSYKSKYCGIKENIQKLSLEKSQSSEAGEIKQQVNINLKEQEEKCCFLGNCQPCCKGDECRNDEKSYPVIFLHGHSFKKWDAPEYSLAAFDEIQLALISGDYIDRGIVLPSDNSNNIPPSSWGKGNNPSTVKVTYYLETYNKNGLTGNEPSKDVTIEEYANRSNKIIELIKASTNRAKVNIIAHSMGGLVVREYIKEFGTNSINKVIFIGTPNHGIFGGVDALCGTFGAPKECLEMSSDNDFIKGFINIPETPSGVRFYTIAGTGCGIGIEDGDGVVRSTSVPLSGATNYKIQGKCSGWSGKDFHTDLLDPKKYPQVLEYIKQILQK